MTEQLEALRKQQAEITAQITTLEDEARRASEIKVGDCVVVNESQYNDGYYGRIVRIADLSGVLPYAVRTFPYNTLVHAYSVARVSADEIRTFLHESAASLS